MAAAVLLLCAVSFFITWVMTLVVKRVAPKVGFIDKPGHRKIHSNPKPLGGGIAIMIGIAVPLIAILIVVWMLGEPPKVLIGARNTQELSKAIQLHNDNPLNDPAYWRGAKLQTPFALSVLGALLAIHILGLIDDRKALGPFVKLIAQLIIAGGLVIAFEELRVLTALGPAMSIALTIGWIVAITNAFNFLDNMDGLSAGVAAVATTAFLITAIMIGQWFVAGMLALLLGALLGFLCFNFSPATIFMGDSGSLVIGLLLGILTVRTTFLQPEQTFGAGWYAVLAPVIVLAVPLYDLLVVSAIRISRGKSPFVGDTNHFSHRLVSRGMSRRTAVLCIYLVTAATSMAAVLLPHVQTTFAAMLIFAQTLLVLGVVALLEQHPLPLNELEKPKSSPDGDI